MSKLKKYKLDDGQIITPVELAKILKCKTPTARSRLNDSSDPQRIFRPYNQRAKTYKIKKFKLTNGKTFDARELSQQSGVPLHTIRCRLSTGWRDYDKLISPVQSHKASRLGIKKPQEVKMSISAQRIYSAKPINDPMFRLAMMRICVSPMKF
jgi:RNA polymerase subunit RPABC4/transcription elongation factor Spt4